MTPTKIASVSALRPSTLLGFGLAAGALVGALAGNPVQAYQATFNLQVANVTGQTSRTFTDGTPTDHTMVMTVNTFTRSTVTPNDNTETLGDARFVTTNSDGLCVISTNCNLSGAESAAAIQLSFSKPIQNFSFKVGNNTPPDDQWSGGSGETAYNSYLRFNVAGSTPIDIALTTLTAGNTYSFSPSILVAANTAIKVGLYCDGVGCPSRTGSAFFISDVIVEAPAPLPLIGTGAAFAWTRRLRRRIKTTPVQSARS